MNRMLFFIIWFNMNKKRFLLNIVVIGLPLFVIFTSLASFSLLKSNFFQEYVKQNPLENDNKVPLQIDIICINEENSENNIFKSLPIDIVNLTKKNLFNVYANVGLEKAITQVISLSSIELSIYYSKGNLNTSSVIFFGIDSTIWKNLEHFCKGNLSKIANEFVQLRTSDTEKNFLGTELNITGNRITNENVSSSTNTIFISGEIWFSDIYENNSFFIKDFLYEIAKIISPSNKIFLTKDNYLLEFLKQFSVINNQIFIQQFEFIYDYEQLIQIEWNSLKQKATSLEKSVPIFEEYDYIEESVIQFNSNLLEFIATFREIYDQFQFSYFIIISPILLVTFFLLEKTIVIPQTFLREDLLKLSGRGLVRKEKITFVIIERIIEIIVSFLLISILTSSLVYSFLDDNAEMKLKFFQLCNNNWIIILILVTLGIIGMILGVQIARFYQMKDIELPRNVFIKEEGKNEAFTNRFTNFLDMLFVIIGSIFFLLGIFGYSSMASDTIDSFTSFSFLMISALGIIILFMEMLRCVNRIYYIFLRLLTQKIWVKQKQIWSFLINHMAKYKNFTLTLFIFQIVLLSQLFFYITPQTLDSHLMIQAHYSIGGDVEIFVKQDNNTFETEIRQELLRWSEKFKFTLTRHISLSFLNYPEINFLIIDPVEFMTISSMLDNELLGFEWKDINMLQEVNSTFIQGAWANKEAGWPLNYNEKLYFNQSSWIELVQRQRFNFFPRIFIPIDEEFNRRSIIPYGIISETTWNKIKGSIPKDFQTDFRTYFILKLESSSNVVLKEVVNSLNNKLKDNIQLKTWKDEYLNLKSIEFTIFSQLSDFHLCVCILLVIIFFFLIIWDSTKEKWLEYRILWHKGFSKYAWIKLTILEIVLLLLLPLIITAPLQIIMIELSSSILPINNEFLPFRWNHNNIFFVITLFLIYICLIGSLIWVLLQWKLSEKFQPTLIDG